VVVFVGGIWYDAIKEGIGALFDHAVDSLEKSAGAGAGARAGEGTPAASGVHEKVRVENQTTGEKFHMKGKMVGRPLVKDHK